MYTSYKHINVVRFFCGPYCNVCIRNFLLRDLKGNDSTDFDEIGQVDALCSNVLYKIGRDPLRCLATGKKKLQNGFYTPRLELSSEDAEFFELRLSFYIAHLRTYGKTAKFAARNFSHLLNHITKNI